jgi:hypothetical protein
MIDRSFVDNGKDICDSNPFYNTLKLLLKYFFLCNSSDVNIMDLIRDVSKTETEFKVFMIYKNYALDIYYSEVKPVFEKEEGFSYDEVIYYIIYLVKTKYEENRFVIKPYISNLDEEDVIEKFNFIKTAYTIQKDQFEKMSNLQEAIALLEESKILEKKSKQKRDKALSLLYKIHSSITDTCDSKLIETNRSLTKFIL